MNESLMSVQHGQLEVNKVTWLGIARNKHLKTSNTVNIR